MIEIQNPQLREIEQRASLFNQKFTGLYGIYKNPFTYQVLMEELRGIRNDLQSISGLSEFDSFIKEHISHSLEAQEAISTWAMKEDSGYSIEDIFELIHGSKLEDLEERIRNTDYEKSFRLSQAAIPLTKYFIRSDTEDVQQMVKKTIQGCADDVLAYGIKKGFFPKGFRPEIIQLPNLESSRSGWNPDLRRMEVDPGSMWIFQLNGEKKPLPIDTYFTLFHELMGHGSHDEYSLTLPEILHLGRYNIKSLVNKAIAEGLAVYRAEKEGVPFTREKSRELGLPQEYVEDRIADKTEFSLDYLAYAVYKGILQAKKKAEPDFNVRQRMKERLKSFPLYRDSEEPSQISGYQALEEASYVTGEKHILDLERKLRTEHGIEIMEKHRHELNQAMSTGAWSWKVYPKFVSWYFKQLTKDSK